MRHHLTTAAVIATLPAISCGLLFVGFRVADALDFHLWHFGDF